jgi:hypothetical protein
VARHNILDAQDNLVVEHHARTDQILLLVGEITLRKASVVSRRRSRQCSRGAQSKSSDALVKVLNDHSLCGIVA